MCWKESYIQLKAQFKTLAMTFPRILAQLTVSCPCSLCLPPLLLTFPSPIGKRTVEVVLKAGCYGGASSDGQPDWLQTDEVKPVGILIVWISLGVYFCADLELLSTC